MSDKATRRHTRDHNTRLVLKTIYRGEGGMSRAAIARATHLTRPTVSTIVSDLVERELVVETGLGPSAGGKPPTLLAINADATQLLCLDLSTDPFRGALFNLRGEVQARESLVSSRRTGDAAVGLVFRLIDALLAKATAPILAVAVGSPGRIDTTAGVVQEAVNLGWRHQQLGSQLAEHYDLPVYLANDSDIAALGEYLYGVGGDGTHLVVVKVGQGVGAGIVLNGRLVAGEGFAAGEVGHIVVEPQGVRCSCGNAGCLEMIAGTRALLLTTGAADWSTLVANYHNGDWPTRRAVSAAAAALGTVIAQLIAIVDGREVVLAGRIVQLGDTFLATVRNTATTRALPTMVSETIIRYSNLGRDIVLLGGSAVILQRELGID